MSWASGPLFSFWLHSPNPVKSILFNNSFWLSVFLFSIVASFLHASCPVGFGANRSRIMLGAMISPTAVCFAQRFLKQTSILSLPGFNTPLDLAIAMSSGYLGTGSISAFKHFECIIKFLLPLTTVVPNGGIMTSLWMQILPFTPLRSYSETSRPFTVFL